MTDAVGGGLIAGLNLPDCKPLEVTIEWVVVERPGPDEVAQHLWLDARFDNPSKRATMAKGEYVGHIRRSRPSQRDKRRPGHPKLRRWK